MDDLNTVVKSETLSSYLSCYSREEERILTKGETRVFTNTKSRLLVHYNDDSIYKGNVKKMMLSTHYDRSSESSATSLNPLQQGRLQDRQLLKGKPQNFRTSQNYFNPTFNVDRLRKRLNINTATSFVKNRTTAKYPLRWNSKYEKESSINESANCSTFIQQLSVRGISENHRADIQFRPNRVAPLDLDKELPQSRQNSDLSMSNQLKDEQPNVQSESSPQITFPSESRLPTLQPSNVNIDFQSVKECLQSSSSAIKKFHLIQSLVLKLTNQEAIERRATVQAIVDNDLFNVSSENGNTALLQNLLWPLNVTTPHPLQASVAKLLNDIVSFEIGREYFNGVSMAKLLTWSRSEQMYDSMGDNLIAALKKLSLNKFQRDDMLNHGLLQWLLNHMEAVEFSASMYHMECMTDLLRMLMSVDNTTEFMFAKFPHLIIVLVRYLNVANEYIQVNVSHALRSLFRSAAAVEIADKMNLHRIFRDHIGRISNSTLKANLQFLYDLFAKFRTNNSSQIESSADVNNVLSHSSDTETTTDFRRQDDSNEEQNERLICEKNLMQKSEIITETQSDEDQRGKKDKMPDSQEPNSSLSADLKACIMQLCLEVKATDSAFCLPPGPHEQINQSETTETNADVSVIYSNLNSGLDQSSSLLSNGSQCASNECKENAIQTLKLHCNKINSTLVVDMDNKSKDLVTTATSKLQSQKMFKNISKVSTEYTDLSSIARDPNARKEILENESFIDELCEKVYMKLRSQLAENFFCGTNCNTNDQETCNCCDRKV